jgi:hypothetical protein
MITDQWRRLGFFYEIRDEDHLWYLAGSRDGLRRFHAILIDYANNPQYGEISAHEHYGPYMYLEIMTWGRPGIDDHSIFGRKEDIQRLAEIFMSKLKSTSAGNHFIIGNDYAPDIDYSILVEVKEDEFDPALLDAPDS